MEFAQSPLIVKGSKTKTPPADPAGRVRLDKAGSDDTAPAGLRPPGITYRSGYEFKGRRVQLLERRFSLTFMIF
jgi:hypothetical protein